MAILTFQFEAYVSIWHIATYMSIDGGADDKPAHSRLGVSQYRN